MKNEDYDLPSLLNTTITQVSIKQRYIAGVSMCSSNQLSNLLIYILTNVRFYLQRYLDGFF